MSGISNSWKDDNHYSTLQSDLSSLSTSAMEEPKNQSGSLYERRFSSSLSDIFVKRLQLSSNNATFYQSGHENNLDEDEPFETMEELEAQTIGNLLPDDDDLLSGVIDDIGFVGQINDRADIDDDIFYNGGGMELEVDNNSDANKASALVVEAANEQLSGPNDLFSGEHPFGEHPSRTLFVRNINSNVEDAELRALFEQYGEIRTIYTACKHRGFVMISYYDIRAARNAMKSLQSKPLRWRKLDIHFSIPKDNPSDKDINQGTLVVFNLDSSVSIDDLHHIFGAYGEIREIREMPHKHNHKFVEFYDVRAAEVALRSLNRSDIAGKKIKLEPSRPGGARRLMQSPELEQEGSNGWKLGCASLGTIASNGLENGSLNGQRSTVCAPINPFTKTTSHAISSTVSHNMSTMRFESIGCCYNQASHADLNLSLNQFNLGAQGQGALCLHPHSLPEFHNGIANGFPCESPNLMSSLSLNVNLRSAEETDNKFLQKVGFGSLNNQYNSGEVIGVSEIGSFPLNGRSYAWDNFNFSHHPSSPVLWSNLSYVNISTHDRSQMHGHGVPRASSHMLNTVPPLHHVGSTIDSNAFLHGSLGNMGFSDIPKLHPVELASYSLFIRASRNCIDATPSHVGISSPHQRGQIFHSRNAMIMAPSSLDGSIDRIKSRRNDANSNQGDSKKKYELDIELIIRGEDPRTTLMLKNIPNKYTSKMLLAAIDELHRGTYDFFYLPIDFKNKCNVGYAFMNMTKPQHIISFYQSFNGKKWEKFNSEKVASLAYARIQGKSALVAHFQNSSLMNEDKRCRPILFHSDGPNAGDQEPFPVGLNIKSRSGRLRTANGIEEQHQGSPVSANAEASPDAAGSPSGSTKNLE
ncbi:protein MEI2-like 4 isoform X2 [Zingiber officinale]|uniref:protein MEI2-like 4 isoform X2 n=1 Tax=Zingiber officinale TaxID=94328 RepID=UPI001C4AA281|nr:protein MEI2-like 4 isoform X2 [Zingiber officinale]